MKISLLVSVALLVCAVNAYSKFELLESSYEYLTHILQVDRMQLLLFGMKPGATLLQIITSLLSTSIVQMAIVSIEAVLVWATHGESMLPMIPPSALACTSIVLMA